MEDFGSQINYITYYKVRKYHFLGTHTVGQVQDFPRPCIGYVAKGSADFLYRGKTITANTGDLIYIAPETRYYSVWKGSPEIEFYSIVFSFADKQAFMDYRFQLLENYPQERFDAMFSAYHTDFFTSIAALYTLLGDIYGRLTRDSYQSKCASMAPAIDYIESNYDQPVKVEYLAQLCGYSEPRFYAQFKKATGVSPIAYKHNICIQHALDDLTNTDDTIEEISQKLGFSSPNYFRRVFQKLIGKSPSEVR